MCYWLVLGSVGSSRLPHALITHGMVPLIGWGQKAEQCALCWADDSLCGRMLTNFIKGLR